MEAIGPRVMQDGVIKTVHRGVHGDNLVVHVMVKDIVGTVITR